MDQNFFFKSTNITRARWERVIMTLFLWCVMSADALAVWWHFLDNEIKCGGSYKDIKRRWVMLSLPAKRVCEFMLLIGHTFLDMLMSHTCFLLYKAGPSSPASGTLTAIWFYCHSLLGAVTVCNLWLNLLMSSSQSFSLINVCGVDVGWHANRRGKDDRHLKVLCTLRSQTQREVWLLCALFYFSK